MGELTKYIAKRDYECKIIRNLITTIRSRSGYLAELKYRFYIKVKTTCRYRQRSALPGYGTIAHSRLK